jgi:glycosyltransferase involved in cell wall biosynthesis
MYSEPRSRRTELVDAVVGISSFVLQRHTQAGLFHSSQQNIIYNSFLPSHPATPALGSPRLKFGYLGRLTATKGLEVLLRSTERLSSIDWALRIAGQGEPSYVNSLQDAYQDERIEYLGYTDTEAFLASIDVLIVPSLWHEPMGRVVVEAFAHGVPVIGSTRGGIPELISDGKTGFTFEPDDPEGLVRAMSRFSDDLTLASSMYDACIEKAQAFHPSVIGRQYIDAYRHAKHQADRRQEGQR